MSIAQGGARGALQTREGAPAAPEVRSPETAADSRSLADRIAREVSEIRQRAEDMAATRTSVEEMRATLAAQANHIAELQEAMTRSNRLQIALPGNDNARNSTQRRAFSALIRDNDWGPLYELRAVRNHQTGEVLVRATTGQVGVDPLGGYLVLDEIDAEIMRIQRVHSNMRQYARVIRIGGGEYTRPVKKSGTTAFWADEIEQRQQTDALSWGEVSMRAHELYAEPAYSVISLEDTVLDLESEVIDDVGEEFSVKENDAYINGNTPKRPRGFLTYPQAVQAGIQEPAFGTVGKFKTGVNAEWGAAGAEGDLFRQIPLYLKPQYLPNAAWFMSRLSMADVIVFKDSQGLYVWQPSLRDGAPSVIAGYPLRPLEEMPAPGQAGATPAAFGDMSQFYTIADRVGLQFLRNPYRITNKVVFQFRKRVGGAVMKSEAVKLVDQSA